MPEAFHTTTNQHLYLLMDRRFAIKKPRKMLREGKWFTEGKPVYLGLEKSHVVNVKDHGAAALQTILMHNAGTGRYLFIYDLFGLSIRAITTACRVYDW